MISPSSDSPAGRAMSYRIVSRLVGLLLLTAAGLKLYGLQSLPTTRSGIFSAAWLQVGLIELEMVLGLWLISGCYPIAARCSAVVVFGIFAVASAFAGWIGQASCGCFGELPINPWWTFVLDCSILAILTFTSPSRRGSDPPDAGGPSRFERWSFNSGLAGVAITTIFLAGGLVAFGSLEGVMAFARGETLYAKPATIDLGARNPSEQTVFRLELENRGARAIRVIGGTFDCSCSVIDELPIEVPPGDIGSVPATIRFPKSGGEFQRRATVWTDVPEHPAVTFLLVGRVRTAE